MSKEEPKKGGSEELISKLHENAPNGLVLFGFQLRPIVGIRYAKGAASLKYGVWVSLVREPDNAFDCNAIRVDTTGGTKVGYVGRDDSKNIHRILDAKEGDALYNVDAQCMVVDTPDMYETQSVVVYYGPETGKSEVLPLLVGLVGAVRGQRA